MAIEVTMPQLSDTMNEGRILTWLKKEGDQVKRGEALAEVATDKADLEIESFHEGTLLKINSPVGTTVKVGSVIAVIGEAGEAANVKPSAPKAVEPQKAPTPAPQPKPAPMAAAPVPASSTNGERLKISPLAKNLADVHGVQYQGLSGSGEGGRIVKRDVERALGREVSSADIQPAASSISQPRPAPAPAPAPRSPAPVVQHPAAANQRPGTASTEPLSQMRKAIADRMAESAATIPHFYVTTPVNVGALLKLKDTLKPLPQYEGLTLNHLVIRATALALRAHPRLNANFKDGSLLQPQEINIGIITAIPDGLLIPVVKSADQLALSDVTAEARALVQRARSGRPKSNDLLGATFCISNMGMFAVESFTAIISPGTGAILAVSSIADEPVIIGGAVQPGKVLRFTLSVDHRIIDGVMAGEFLTELKRLLEEPVLLLA